MVFKLKSILPITIFFSPAYLKNTTNIFLMWKITKNGSSAVNFIHVFFKLVLFRIERSVELLVTLILILLEDVRMFLNWIGNKISFCLISVLRRRAFLELTFRSAYLTFYRCTNCNIARTYRYIEYTFVLENEFKFSRYIPSVACYQFVVVDSVLRKSSVTNIACYNAVMYK